MVVAGYRYDFSFLQLRRKIIDFTEGDVLKASLTNILQGRPSVHSPLSQFLP